MRKKEMITIASWNVNSLRARLSSFDCFIKEYDPDIVCLQELKVQNDLFPSEISEKYMYNVYTNGQKQYNGVAILSKLSCEDCFIDIKDYPSLNLINQRRFISCAFLINQKYVEISCIYAPNGNPLGSEKYDYKKKWYKDFCAYLTEKSSEDYFFVLGDFNIIPNEIDVYNPEAFKNDAVFCDEMRQIFTKSVLGNTYLDVFDHFYPIPHRKNAYTYWSYMHHAWSLDNGMRLDHVICPRKNIDKIKKMSIIRNIRALHKTSDHCPIIAQIEI